MEEQQDILHRIIDARYKTYLLDLKYKSDLPEGDRKKKDIYGGCIAKTYLIHKDIDFILSLEKPVEEWKHEYIEHLLLTWKSIYDHAEDISKK